MEHPGDRENAGPVDARDDSESFMSRTLKRVTGTSGTFDLQEKMKWFPGFRVLFGTNHDVNVKTDNHVKTEKRIETENRLMIDFTPQVMSTLFGITALWGDAWHVLTPIFIAPSWRSSLKCGQRITRTEILHLPKVQKFDP